MGFSGASAQNNHGGHGALSALVGFNGLFFPALIKQRRAFAAAPTEVWRICRAFSAAYPDHNYTVPVQISREVILPPGVTRVPRMKGGGSCTLCRLRWRGGSGREGGRRVGRHAF